ncbi:hypothetical protein [Streptomyces sp. NPDC088925]|uniref:hypothetical protein n=1 Tax=Streptomyces sp. NPDC088925 TaxID=3365914 RepID=UPI0037FD37F9
MPQIRLMGANSDDVRRTADAVVRALRAWPETRVGDVSDPVPNRRGNGCRIYIEVLADVATDGVEVTFERKEPQPPQWGATRPELPTGRRRRLPH